MSTHDYVLANQSGSSFRSDLNNALAAIVSSNSSATEPATPYAYQYWIDTSATPELIKQRNSTNDGWITLGEINGQTLASDGTVAKPGIAFASDINTGLRRSAADTLQVVTAGADAVTVLPDGKVGVGGSPNFKLDVFGDFRAVTKTQSLDIVFSTTVHNTNDAQLVLQKARGGESGPTQINAGDDLGDIAIKGYDGSDYNVGFKIKCTSTTNTGNFAPNTKFVNDGEDFFTLEERTGTKFHRQLYTSTSISQGSNGFRLQANGTQLLARNTGSAGNVLQAFGSAGEFRIKGDGDAQNTNNNYGSISDSKLKENIVDANSQWDDIKAVQVRNYNFKAETNYPTHTQIGVVAQELETVSPGLVKDNVDEDADGNDLGTVTKSVSYSVLYMKALKALQEAMTRIETLETKVAALEAAN